MDKSSAKANVEPFTYIPLWTRKTHPSTRDRVLSRYEVRFMTNCVSRSIGFVESAWKPIESGRAQGSDGQARRWFYWQHEGRLTEQHPGEALTRKQAARELLAACQEEAAPKGAASYAVLPMELQPEDEFLHSGKRLRVMSAPVIRARSVGLTVWQVGTDKGDYPLSLSAMTKVVRLSDQ